MNAHFESAIKAALRINKQVGSFWKDLVLFAVESNPKDEEQLKEAFSVAEKEARTTVAKGTKLSNIAAYRSAKSVILAAYRNDVAVVNAEGVVRGKTEVEKDIKAVKAEGKTELDRFKSLMNSLSAVSVKFERKDEYATAFMLVKEECDKIAEKLATFG